jgi:Lon protease-like protein
VPPLPSVIPLFPLPNAVLFPKMPLPLNVFEPRYRKMVADVLGGHRLIGMALLRPGWEVDYQGRPAVYPAGCAGYMEQCEPQPDGRFQILLRGVSRFRIVEEHAGQPYRLATVSPSEESMGADAALEEARRKVTAAIAQAADGPAILVTQPEITHDLFVNALCQSLALAPVEQQSLLECDSILARYARLLEILEFRRLEHAHGRGGETRVH